MGNVRSKKVEGGQGGRGGHSNITPDRARIFIDEHLNCQEGQLYEIVREWKSGGRKTLKIAADRKPVVDLRRDCV